MRAAGAGGSEQAAVLLPLMSRFDWENGYCQEFGFIHVLSSFHLCALL